MILEVIVTTMNDQIIKLINDFFPEKENVIYQLSHQITNANENQFLKEVEHFLQRRQDVRYFYYFEKGLSLHRNRTIEKSIGDICLVADDDVIYTDNFHTTIFRAFQKIKNADIITFKARFPDGSPFKSYPQKIYKHNLFTSIKVSSFEIAYRRKSLLKYGLLWDERFGLGGKIYTNHMENIFSADAIKKRMNVYFYPEFIVSHPYENSGFHYTEHLVFSKGAAFIHMFGLRGFIILFLFSIKKYNAYKDKFSYMQFLKISLKGSFHYIKNKKEREC